MKLLLHEPAAALFKEGFKAGLLWVVFSSYLTTKNESGLAKAFLWGLLVSASAGLAAYEERIGMIARPYIGNTVATSFAFFLLASAVALYISTHPASRNKTVPGGIIRKIKPAAVFVFTVIFFLPDLIGASMLLRDAASVAESGGEILLSALAGFFGAAILWTAVLKLVKPDWVGRFFGVPQLLLFMAMVKLLGSGIRGLAELSLIPSVQRGFMKFSHDFIHQTFVLLMVPDHPLLKSTTWNFIGFFFGPNFGSVAALFMLLALPMIFIRQSLFGSLPEASEETAAGKRKFRALILSDRRNKALPVAFFVCLVIAAWFSGSEEAVSNLYLPKPKPVVSDKGFVLIPVNDPTMDVKDGDIHKFSLAVSGEEIRLLVVMKQDKQLAVCLDACEICPPVGYGKRQDMVVCVYCATPIPINTLGKPGGCNPVPLLFTSDDRFIRIPIEEITSKWSRVKSGSGKGEGGK